MKDQFKFWNPLSGVVGGAVFGLVIIFVAIILMPPLIKFIQWWSGVWGI